MESPLTKDRRLSNENAFSSPKGLPYAGIYPNSDEDDPYDNEELELHISENLNNILDNKTNE